MKNVMIKKVVLFMSKRVLFVLFSLLFIENLSAQNLLPLDWNIAFKSDACLSTRGAKARSSVCTLLSWERQGYFEGDGDCTLSTTFNIKELQKSYLLLMRMQCEVRDVKINGNSVAQNIKNTFWNNRDAYSTFRISKEILRKGENKISLDCSSLGYTGGVSHTMLVLKPFNDKAKEYVRVSLPTADHVCLGNDRVATIHYYTTRQATIRLRVENDFHQSYLDSTINVSPRDSIINIDLNKLCSTPGFYQITAVMHGVGYSGNAQWMAVKPEEAECDNRTAIGFEDYWAKAKAELAAIKPEFKLHRIDSLCQKSKRDVYIVEMQSLGNLTVRGYYFVPRTAGKHRAVLQVPGYGYGFENIDGFLNDDTDRAELALCVRGHGISADVFHPGFGVPGVWGYKLCNSDSIAYRGIYMDCVRAIDFLCSRPEIDAHRIGVKGGSQGGGLTLATAALCSDRIAACAYFDPFPCDMRHQIQVRTICQSELKRNLAYYGNPCSYLEVLCVQDLIDTRSFASKIKCAVLYTPALFDDDCPVEGGFAAYNLIASPKEYKVFPNEGHVEGFTHEAMIMSWLDKKLSE